ncbi:hypothetical protein BDM02DRAFT_3128017 [Thelephora ganbajun]|uniref:Uncharacterized protein n=1 Tax=Thelephora ganbajun TaxID=370292 RepID=A0ACB6ZJR5_THEGA|nr:hypothetical protein BDM02DRAFT_3128017 [Thelephora ganbajun]
MAAATALREALNQGISSGNLVDTKIILYSHRDSSGRICRPKALYANSHILKTVPYFNDQSQSKDFKEATDEEESAEDYGYSSDSDLEDDEDEKSTLFKHATKPKVHPFDPFATPGKDKIICEEHEEHMEKGKVVKIPDIAFVTYDEIRSLYIEQLGFVWMEDTTTETTRASVDKKIDSFVGGDLEHAAEMLSTLWEIANKDGDIAAPSKTAPAAARVMSPAHWDSVKIAPIKSIRKGMFFDRKYWARHSKAGDVLKPVYLSSTVMSDKAQQLNKLVKYLKGQNPLVSDLERDVNVESDCEGDSPTVKNETPTTKEEKEEPTRAVLITGTFSAWKSLFFYRCTDTILYAPLKSQGADSRLNHIHQNTVTVAPHPCSPKSIYVLANLLGIQPLCDSAFEDIKGKVSLDNVVQEVLSWVTAGQEKIMEMQCELLISSFRDPKTIGLVKENIGHISDGSSSHCGGALKLGLKKAFELKKRKRQPPSVLLRCSNTSCSRYKNPVSYSSIGPNYYCQACSDPDWDSWYYQCVGCGHKRTSSYASCQSCGKKFI